MNEANYIDKHANIENLKLGSGCKIFDALVKNSTLGNNVIIRDFSRVENSVFGENVDIQRLAMIYNSIIDDFTYVGRNFTAWYCNIGKFCSISWNVSIGGANHDYSRITQHAFLYASQFGFLGKENLPKYNRFNTECEVGNDVWIASNAIICRGVHIGDGAVIAAGAVVTKDVEPYTIVAGVPAKFVKRRYSEELAQKLLDLQWWNLPVELIKVNLGVFSEKISDASVEKIRDVVRKYKAL